MWLKRLIWQKLLSLRFRLWQRHRFDQLVLEWVAGRPFLILPQVFNPTLFLSSEFMVSALTAEHIPVGARVLDMGTGSGIGSVFAAQWASEVVAVDVNPTAVRCARINVLLNRREASVSVLEGDLFSPLPGQQFDVILFNPPYFEGQAVTPLAQAFYGREVIERFAAEVETYLAENGRIFLLLSSLADEKEILAHFTQFHMKIARQQDVRTELLTLYQLTHRR